jgi:hypothetical protein
MLVDDGGDLRILVAFAVNDVTPMAPDGADVEEDGFVFGAGAGEGFFAPFVPVNRLMRGGTQIRAGRVFQAVFGLRGHEKSFRERKKEQAPKSTG